MGRVFHRHHHRLISHDTVSLIRNIYAGPNVGAASKTATRSREESDHKHCERKKERKKENKLPRPRREGRLFEGGRSFGSKRFSAARYPARPYVAAPSLDHFAYATTEYSAPKSDVIRPPMMMTSHEACFLLLVYCQVLTPTNFIGTLSAHFTSFAIFFVEESVLHPSL